MSSGGSTGNPDKDDYNIEEFSDHHEAVIKIIQNRYNPKRMIILGHSWGGFLSAYYLIANGDSSLATERQAEIDGLLYGSDVSTHYQYIEDAGGMLVQRNRNDELTRELAPRMLFFSPFHFYNYYSNQNTIRSCMDITGKTLANPNQPNLSSLTVPTLFIAGEDDKIAFKYMSEEWFDMLGSYSGSDAEEEEYFKMYRNCAHAAFLDAPDQFQEDVVSFIENL